MIFHISVKKYSGVVTMIITGIIAAFVLLEMILQFTDPTDYNNLTNDPSTGLLIYRPNSSFEVSSSCFENQVLINNEGFHGVEVSVAKPKGVYRIAIIGSSFVEALQVPLSGNFASLLQDKLNAQASRPYTYQVIPIGFSGNGTFLDILYYLRYGVLLKPDLVIDLTTEYELSRNAPGVLYPAQFTPQGNLIESLPQTAHNPFTVAVKNVVRQSKLIMNALNRYDLLKNAASQFVLKPTFLLPSRSTTEVATSTPESSEIQEWQTETKLLMEFDRLVISHDAQFMIASWTTPNAASSTMVELSTHLSQIAASSSVAYLDLTPIIARKSASSTTSPTWSCDDHWDTVGHQYAADALYTYLIQHPGLIGQ